MSAITAKARRKMKKYAVLTREPRCFLGSFDFSWEQRKANEVCSIGTGKSNTQDQVDDGKYPFYIRSDVPVRSNKYLYDCEAVITIGDGNIGKVFHYVNGKFDLHQRCYKMTDFKDIWGKYFFYYFSTKFYDRAMKMTAKATVDSVRLEMISEMDIKKPPQISEQKQIAEFFTSIDHLITLHQRKCALLFSSFQALISMMFTTSTFSWEQRKLGELVDRVVRKNTNNESTLPLTISAQYGLVDQITYFNNRVASRDVSNYYLVLNGEFAYNKSTSDGYPFGAVKRLDLYEKGVLSTLYIVFAPKKEQQIDSDYLTVFFDTDRWHKGVAERAAEGARNHGLLNISAEDFFDIDLSVPKDIVEQKQIGAFIRQLDNLITLHQRKYISFTGRAGRLISTVNKKRITSSWEQRKLGDIADIVGGGTPSTGNQSYWDGDIDWYAPAEIADQIYANSSQKKITGLGYENSSAKMLPPGTVLFTSRAGIGKTAILTRKGCTNQGFQSIVPHRGELDSYFIFSRTEELKRYGELVGAGSTFVEVSGKQMAVMELMMPPTMREQQTIGGFFQQLDHLITLHQRQPFLQSPPDISLIVQLTPPFYTFSWEQRKLASLCEKFTDGDWIESKDQSDFGVRLVQTGNVGVAEYLDKPNNKKWISEDTFDRLHCEEVLPGDILISRLPEPAGRACIVPLLGTKMITAVDCTIVRTAPDMSNKFLVQYLSSQAYFDDVNTCLAGGTRQRISRGNLANFNVPIPVKKSEQDAIGMFFGYLDNLITLHQRQTIVYAVIRSIRKVILAERQYFAPPMVRKSP